MGLAEVEHPAGLEQLGRDRRPAIEVGQPADRSDAREGDLEAAIAEGRDGVVHVGLDEGRRDVRLVGQRPCLRDRRRREVETGDRRAASCPAQGVDAEVALEMDEAAAAHVADLLDLPRTQPSLPALKPATS